MRTSLGVLVVIALLGIDNVCSQVDTSRSRLNQKIIAMTLDELKQYGVITGGRNNNCIESLRVAIFEDPDLKKEIGRVHPGTFAKYERLSEIRRIPYWAPLKEHQLPNGERFRVWVDSMVGWVGDHSLMTFSSAWRERNTERFLKVFINTAVCVYFSGQYETTECTIVTVWEREAPYYVWELKGAKFNPIGNWLYSYPKVDTVYFDEKKVLTFQLSSIGGDAEDRWGEYALYSFKNGDFTLLSKWGIDTTYSR
jgi:hypothetical protein